MRKFVLILFLLFCTIIFILAVNPIIVKWITGSARLIGKEIQNEVYINGKRKSEVKLFHVNSDFYNKKKKKNLVLYLIDLKQYDGIPVIIIDLKDKFVGFPNASISDYNLYFGNLIQSESGANVIIPINDGLKGWGYEPKLKINGKEISFELQDYKKQKKYKIRIFIS
jgi:hypothetical protein